MRGSWGQALDPQTSIEKLDFVFYPSPYTLDA